MATSRLCSIPDCGKPPVARGLCSAHYQRIQKKGYVRPPKPCSVEGCTRQFHAQGLCIKHYKRLLKYGDPLGGSTDWGAAKRFLSEALSSTDKEACINWPFARNPLGLAQIRINEKTRNVPRLACEHIHGPAPTPKHQAAHSCGKGWDGCINPHHLSWKTQTENEADKVLHGTSWQTRRHPWAKLTAEDVREIRALRAKGVKREEIAQKFGITKQYIYNICARLCWKRV